MLSLQKAISPVKAAFTNRNPVEICLFFAAILPALLLGWLVIRYSVNVPAWDQWDTPGRVFENIHSGTLSFQDFTAQHNESRKFFPRLFFVGLAYLTNWNTQYEMLATFTVACSISVAIYRLSQMTLQLGRVPGLVLLALANLLVFSPAQWENWLWGIQIIVFVPIVCILLCLIVVESRLSFQVKVLLCAALSTLSTYSYANGMLCWVAALSALFLSKKSAPLKQNGKWLIVYVVSFVTVVLSYFHDYQKPGKHPSFIEATVHPADTASYFMAFIGSPFSGGDLGVAITLGSLLIVIFTGLLVYSLANFRRSLHLFNSTLSWFIVGFYVLASGFITTLGRVGFGVEQSLSSRYTTFSIYLPVTIIYLTFAIASELKQQGYAFKTAQLTHLEPKVFSAGFLSAIMALFFALQLSAFAPAVQSMQMGASDRLYLKTCLTFINFVDDTCKARLFPSVPVVEQRAAIFNEMGFINPKIAESPIIKPSEKAARLEAGSSGWFDQLISSAPNQYVAKGWAILPEQGKVADAVVITYKEEAEGKAGRWKVFTIAQVLQRRDDVAKKLNKAAYRKSGWEASLSTQDLPKGQLRLAAWAYDTKTGETSRIGESHLIQN